MANRLASETSPYLLQHKDNPVDWFPWGEEALRRAREEDKPVFLSIGYAACHWCHVMEHESFEDPRIAQILRDNFISIKVDREERPDLDSIYMDAVVAMTGQGGWPMSVFLTPDGVPFFGGTYYPSEPRHNMPSFSQVLMGVAEAWKNRRDQVLQGGAQVLGAIRQGDAATVTWQGDEGLAPDLLAEAVRNAWSQFDWKHAGWGGAPKFPQSMTIELLMRYHLRTGDSLAMEMVTKTLDAMAKGGMYDILGGGFHRYSVDDLWLVPHFEKMLYDNAQLARAFTHAWQITRNPDYRRVAEETLDYVGREMTDSAGGFYSSQDADSEGEEGKFFVWMPAEVEAGLGPDARLFMDAYGATQGGNFEGRSILTRSMDDEALARRHGLAPEGVPPRLAEGRRKLLGIREGRVHPATDDKVLAAWNGLMLAAFAEAGRAFGRADYLQAAERNARFLWTEMRTADGRMFRSWRGGQAKLNGYLEDYANVAEGMLALYQSTFDATWFTAARSLADAMLLHFDDPSGGFFDTPDDHETLVTRPKSMQDNALPSGNSMAATVLGKLSAYTADARYADKVEQSLRMLADVAVRHPTGFAQWLSAMAFHVYGAKEVALVGERDGQDLRSLVEVTFERYRPEQVVAVSAPGEPSPVPLLEQRETRDHKATAYVCQNFACAMPVTEPEELRKLLEE